MIQGDSVFYDIMNYQYNVRIFVFHKCIANADAVDAATF